jgi:hypothetical protein
MCRVPGERRRRRWHGTGSSSVGPVRVERVSRPVRTTPFGVTEQPPFTNAALAIETDLPPRLGCFIFRRWSGGLAATGLQLRDDGVALSLVLKRHRGGQIGRGRARAPVRYLFKPAACRRSLRATLAGFAARPTRRPAPTEPRRTGPSFAIAMSAGFSVTDIDRC